MPALQRGRRSCRTSTALFLLNRWKTFLVYHFGVSRQARWVGSWINVPDLIFCNCRYEIGFLLSLYLLRTSCFIRDWSKVPERNIEPTSNRNIYEACRGDTDSLTWCECPLRERKRKKESMRQFYVTVIIIYVYTSLTIPLSCSYRVRWPSFRAVNALRWLGLAVSREIKAKRVRSPGFVIFFLVWCLCLSL